MKRSVLLLCLLFSVLLFAEPMPNNPGSLPYGATPRVDIDHRPATITLPTYYMPASVEDLVEMLNRPSEVTLPPAKPTDVYMPLEGETIDYMCYGNQVPSGETWECVHMIAQYNSWLKRADAWKKEGNLFIPNVVAGRTKLHGLGVLGIAPALNSAGSQEKTATVFQANAIGPMPEPNFHWDFSWVIPVLLFLLLAALVLWFVSQRRQLRRDPLVLGEPFVRGGVTPENVDDSLREAGALLLSRDTGRTVYSGELDIVSKRMGRMYGVTDSYYRDRTRPLVTRYTGQVGYRFDVRSRVDGHTEQFDMAEECGNPVRSGLVSRVVSREGFRFVPMTDEEIARHNAERYGRVPATSTTTATPEVVPAEVPTQQASTPAPEQAPVVEEQVQAPAVVTDTESAPSSVPEVAAPVEPKLPEEVVPAKVSFTAAAHGSDAHLIRANRGVRNLTVTVEEDGIVIRFREK